MDCAGVVMRFVPDPAFQERLPLKDDLSEQKDRDDHKNRLATLSARLSNGVTTIEWVQRKLTEADEAFWADEDRNDDLFDK